MGKVPQTWWEAWYRFSLSPSSIVASLRLGSWRERWGSSRHQVIVYSYDNSFLCLHSKGMNSRAIPGLLWPWLERDPVGNWIFSVSWRESETKTFINHHENPLLPYCLWASSALNCLLGAGHSEQPELTPQDWFWPTLTPPAEGWLPPARPPPPTPSTSSHPQSSLTLDYFFLNADAVLCGRISQYRYFSLAQTFIMQIGNDVIVYWGSLLCSVEIDMGSNMVFAPWI